MMCGLSVILFMLASMTHGKTPNFCKLVLEYQIIQTNKCRIDWGFLTIVEGCSLEVVSHFSWCVGHLWSMICDLCLTDFMLTFIFINPSYCKREIEGPKGRLICKSLKNKFQNKLSNFFAIVQGCSLEATSPFPWCVGHPWYYVQHVSCWLPWHML